MERSATLKVTVPAGNWAGGSFWAQSARDLSSFNALTFYAKANTATELSECRPRHPHRRAQQYYKIDRANASP